MAAPFILAVREIVMAHGIVGTIGGFWDARRPRRSSDIAPDRERGIAQPAAV